MADWARIAATNIAREIKGFEDDTTRNRKLLALMRKRGRFTMNQDGDGFNWRMKYRRADAEPNDGSQPVSIAAQNRWVKAGLDYRGYAIADAMTKRERLKNRGPSAIIKVFGNMVPELISDLDDHISEELYVDGNAAGNDQRFHGIESFMGTNGTITQTGTTGATARSANAADAFACPTDTYANVITTPGNYGGAWTGCWPAGVGDAEYDFNSPVIVNYTCTSSALGFAAGGTWALNAKLATRLGIMRTRRNGSKKGGLDLILIENEMYRQFLELQDTKERFMASGPEMKELGFGGETFSFDGVDVTFEYGLPAPGGNGTQASSVAASIGVGYGFNIDQMELLSMQANLFEAEGPDYDVASRTWRVVVDAIGNLKFESPRNFLKFGSYA